MRTIQEQLLSVVIPTLDAGVQLAGSIAALDGAGLVREIIVVDGGSADDTVLIAHAVGARVVVAPRGRGGQLAAGAAAAGAEWLLFLHADCRLEPGWAAAVGDFAAVPGATGRAGYFTFALDDPHPAARLLECIVRWRCRLFALPYGDQGLLISRRLYDMVGGFAGIPLMEDVDLVRRLGRRRLMPIAIRAVSSARRYRDGGYLRRPLRNLMCLALYLAGIPPRLLARFYG
jgi:rSAM/selenodomain-associated transferase 2